jgi:hypothetical protein
MAAWKVALAGAEARYDGHAGTRFLWREDSISIPEMVAQSTTSNEWLDQETDVESAFLRRINAVYLLDPSSITVWTRVPKEFHVDMWVDEFDADREDRLIALLTNPRLAPPMTLIKRSNHWLTFEVPSERRLILRTSLAPNSQTAQRASDLLFGRLK